MNNYSNPYCPCTCPPGYYNTRNYNLDQTLCPVLPASLLIRNSGSKSFSSDSTILVKLYANGAPQQDDNKPFVVSSQSDLGWFTFPPGTILRADVKFQSQGGGWTSTDRVLEPGQSYILAQHATCCFMKGVDIEIILK